VVALMGRISIKFCKRLRSQRLGRQDSIKDQSPEKKNLDGRSTTRQDGELLEQPLRIEHPQLTTYGRTIGQLARMNIPISAAWGRNMRWGYDWRCFSKMITGFAWGGSVKKIPMVKNQGKGLVVIMERKMPVYMKLPSGKKGEAVIFQKRCPWGQKIIRKVVHIGAEKLKNGKKKKSPLGDK